MKGVEIPALIPAAGKKLAMNCAPPSSMPCNLLPVLVVLAAAVCLSESHSGNRERKAFGNRA